MSLLRLASLQIHPILQIMSQNCVFQCIKSLQCYELTSRYSHLLLYMLGSPLTNAVSLGLYILNVYGFRNSDRFLPIFTFRIHHLSLQICLLIQQISLVILQIHIILNLHAWSSAWNPSFFDEFVLFHENASVLLHLICTLNSEFPSDQLAAYH